LAALDESIASQHRSRTILESITDSLFSLHCDWRFVCVIPAAERLQGRAEGKLTGRSLWREYLAIVVSHSEAMRHRVTSGGASESITTYYAKHDRWYEARAYAAADGLSVDFRHVTDPAQRDAVIRASEERPKLAFDAGERSFWNIDPVAKVQTSTKRSAT